MGIPHLQADPLADLRVNYFERLKTRVDSLKEFVRIYPQPGAVSTDAYSDYHRTVHSMISSSAIFGYAELSKVARVTEIAFETHSQSRDQALVDQVKNLIRVAAEVIHSVHNHEQFDKSQT